MISHSTKNLGILLLLIIVNAISAYSYEPRVESEGTSFWFAIPKCNRAVSETQRGSETGASEELFITSKVNTTVRIYDSNKNYLESHQVMAKSVKVVPVLAMSQNEEGEVVKTNKSFYVESDDPITLNVYVAWKWTGESYRILPADWLGNEYYTLNLYQDYCKMAYYANPSEAIQDHPSQILIVATEDQTEVTYYPTAPTDKVKAGESKTITMNEGDTYLILGKINQFLRQLDETDLTGTRIVADKKIAVFSGHTKGSFPRFAPTYYGGLKADFLRNMLFDAIWPTNLLGLEYVTVPIMYTNSSGGREMQGIIEHERGDMIRFVATQDSTDIFEMQSKGTWTSKPLNYKPLKKGEFYQIDDRETPGYFKSNYPVLVGQYGKGWFWWYNGIVHKEEYLPKDKEDEIQNPARCGQGSLCSVTPSDKWINYAGYNGVGAVNNHITLVFKTAEADSIFLDDKRISDTYSTKIKQIPGSPYSYLSSVMVKGAHYMYSNKKDVLFSVYVYGNMDGSKDGFAYGYPAGINYYDVCDDTVVVESTIKGKEFDLKFTSIDMKENSTCSKMQFVKAKSTNEDNPIYTKVSKTGSKSSNIKVTFSDPLKDGSAKVMGMTNAGAAIEKTITYTAPKVKFSDRSIRMYLTKDEQEKSQEISIENFGTEPVTIDSIYLDNPNNSLTIASAVSLKNIVLPAGEILKLNIIGKFTKPISIDYGVIYMSLVGAEINVCEVEFTQSQLSSEQTPVNWDNLKMHVDTPIPMVLTIKNHSLGELQITDMSQFYPNIFKVSAESGLLNASTSNPYKVNAGESVDVTVTLKPNTSVFQTVEYKDTITVSSANDDKFQIQLSAMLQAAPLIVGSLDTLSFKDLSIKQDFSSNTNLQNISKINVKIDSVYFVSNNSAVKFETSDVIKNSQFAVNESKSISINGSFLKAPESDITAELYLSYLGSAQKLYTLIIPKSEVNSVAEAVNQLIIPNSNYGLNDVIKFADKDNLITSISIWNELGELVREANVNALQFDLPGNSFAVGAYYFQVNQNEKITKGKFLITGSK